MALLVDLGRGLRFFSAAASAAVVLGFASVSLAASLDEAACKTLDAQQRILDAQGVKADVAKGPDWAKATVSASRIALIKHYIYLKEQVAFRCPSLVVAAVPELAEPEAKHPLAGKAGQAKGKAASKAAKPKKKERKRKKSADSSAPPPPSAKPTTTQ